MDPNSSYKYICIYFFYVFLVCSACSNRNYTTHKRLKAVYKLEKKKWCKFCREHTLHKEKKL